MKVIGNAALWAIAWLVGVLVALYHGYAIYKVWAWHLSFLPPITFAQAVALDIVVSIVTSHTSPYFNEEGAVRRLWTVGLLLPTTALVVAWGLT